jgi:hypothetical protein
MRTVATVECVGELSDGMLSGFVFNWNKPQIVEDISPNDPMLTIGVGGMTINNKPAIVQECCGYSVCELIRMVKDAHLRV